MKTNVSPASGGGDGEGPNGFEAALGEAETAFPEELAGLEIPVGCGAGDEELERDEFAELEAVGAGSGAQVHFDIRGKRWGLSTEERSDEEERGELEKRARDSLEPCHRSSLRGVLT